MCSSYETYATTVVNYVIMYIPETISSSKKKWGIPLKIIAWNEEKLSDLVALWNQELAKDFPMREALFKQNSFDDVNASYDGSFIALDAKENVIGFVVTKHWQEEMDVEMPLKKGWIQALLVDHNHRGQGLGAKLLGQAEEYLLKNGIEEVQLGGDPFHYFPGVPDQYQEVQSWAAQKGYVKHMDAYDLVNRISKEYPFPDNDTVEFSLLHIEDKDAFIAFLNRCFPGRWEYEAMKYFEMNGNGREFVVAKKKGKIIGFCRLNDGQSPFIAQNVYWSPLFKHDLGGIGPLGIDENEQKQGYGLAIIEAAMNILIERNIRTIVIDWTGLVDFYAKLDFKPWKKYGIYVKKLYD